MRNLKIGPEIAKICNKMVRTGIFEQFFFSEIFEKIKNFELLGKFLGIFTYFLEPKVILLLNENNFELRIMFDNLLVSE